MPVDSVLFPLLYFYSAFKLFARLVSNAAISGFPRTFIKRSASTPSGTFHQLRSWFLTIHFFMLDLIRIPFFKTGNVNPHLSVHNMCLEEIPMHQPVAIRLLKSQNPLERNFTFPCLCLSFL